MLVVVTAVAALLAGWNFGYYSGRNNQKKELDALIEEVKRANAFHTKSMQEEDLVEWKKRFDEEGKGSKR